MRPSVASAIWDLAAEEELQVYFPSFAEGVLRLFTQVDQKPAWDRWLTRLATEGYVQSYGFQPEIIPLVIDFGRKKPDLGPNSGDFSDVQALDKMTETLAHSSILVTMGAAMDGRVILAVDRKNCTEIHEILRSQIS